jgi:hypothetical protein
MKNQIGHSKETHHRCIGSFYDGPIEAPALEKQGQSRFISSRRRCAGLQGKSRKNKSLPRPALIAATMNAVNSRGPGCGLLVTEPPRMHSLGLLAARPLHLVIGFISVLVRLIWCAHDSFPF